MKNTPVGRAPSAETLRDRAEASLQGAAHTASTPDAQSQRLLHELQVHQIELELQNEELKIARDAAEEAAARYTDLYDFAPVGYLTLDRMGAIIQSNLACAQLLGAERAELAGKHLGAWVAEPALPVFKAFLTQVFVNGSQSGCELALCAKGKTFTMQIDARVSDDGQQCRLVLKDITATKAHQGELEHIAHYDTLTGLPNRHLLSDRMQQAIAHCQRHAQCMAVVYLDLDNIKAVNDQHGHAVGDALLIEVSKRMKAALRDDDTLARIGGDEFVAVLGGLSQNQDSLPFIERLLSAASAAMRLCIFDQEAQTDRELLVQVSASIGVTFYPQDPVNADQLMRHADQAMYLAKQAGKNRYHLFDVVQDAAIHSRHEDLQRFADALDNNELLLHYQPKVNMRTGQVTGTEALIRWQHPERGLLPPSVFLPTVENHLLSIDMGEWVIAQALTQIGAWRTQGMDMHVSVNIGALQLKQPNFAVRLGEILAAHPEVSPRSLRLEILETSALEDITTISATMNACQALGVSFALDDFGTGYSSLTYLKHLPAEMLKIDQSFVRNMTQDPDDLAIVKGVIGLADIFHRQVIAEGVETKAHGDLLLGIGCDLAQGYGIARPMHATDMPQWVAKWQTAAAWTA